MKRAAWWRSSLVRLGAAAPLGLFGGCFDDLMVRPDPPPLLDEADEMERQMAALQLQTQEGWDVGRTGTDLQFHDAVGVDAVGGTRWRTDMTLLASRLRPWRADLLPWNVPTLFQSLLGNAGESLRAQMKPVESPALAADFARGMSLRGLFGGVGWPRDTAIIIDLPGPRAMALSAALADHFDPVFTFGNWPHPRGVVPAHETLGAALFYLPVFDRAVGVRPHDAPPMWVLDANRLAPYVDQDQQFDNRYTVKLPSPGALRDMGIAHILYVNESGADELDDLNQAFVGLDQAKIDLRILSLADFERGDGVPGLACTEPDPNAEGAPCDGSDGNVDAVDDAGDPWLMDLSVAGGWFWWGGAYSHAHFWDHSWYHAPRWIAGPPGYGRRALPMGPATAPRRTLSMHYYYPTPRSTLFNGGRMSTGGFGQVTVRASRFDGHMTGMRGGSASAEYHGAAGGHGYTHPGSSSLSGTRSWSGGGRSGSFGRMGGGGMSG